MPVTVKVNEQTLTHKGSGGFSVASLPDTCLTPTPGGRLSRCHTPMSPSPATW
jgi:hypothetical protein